jgi:DnaJ-domain-containing protein 1
MAHLPQLAVASNPQMQDLIRQFREALQRALPEGSFAERERAALDVSNEVVRQVLQAELQALAKEFGDQVEVDAVRYRKPEQGTVSYHSLCGPLVVTRPTYRQLGQHNGPTLGRTGAGSWARRADHSCVGLQHCPWLRSF